MTPGLADFAGRWRLVRVIQDRRAGQEGRFEGEAAFTAEGAVLRYREAGWLRLGDGAPLAAERRQVWRAEGHRIAVDHADGRAFHAFDPAAPAARHDCPPDIYRVRYDFAAWPLWTAEWEVAGPRKDYSLRALYAPLAPAAG
ncbi:MAG: DUF6314 family protein [Rhodobacteraceae bacterium]|nr:DUF6314 family protein [Paracoccaceae bacterium]